MNVPEVALNILQSWPEFSRGLDDPQWLADLRRRGFDYLEANGLPTPKLEGWKFTNVIPMVRDFGAQQGQAKVTYAHIPGIEITPLVKSVIERGWVRGLIEDEFQSSDPNADPVLGHLCNVYFRDGVSIEVGPNTAIEEPLHIKMECGDGQFYMVHTAIRVGANSSLTIIEDHRGVGIFWKNMMSHILLEPGAKLTHIRIQEDSMKAVYTQNTKISVAKDAAYEAVTLSTGAAISRNQVHVILKESGAFCHINGVNLMRGKQHADTTILVEHKAPHCQSKQNIRTILDDQAHAVFQGKIHVHQPAQKSDGYQLSRALILSEGAEMDTKPELEIYADDVKCSHGATTGQMDEEPLFYMQSRGIGRDEAKSLLIESFAAEVLNIVVDRSFYGMLEERVRAWLG